mgnify:CR=1 FL=1
MSDSEILVRSTYYLGIRTGVKPDAQSYQEQAEGLVEHLQCILEDLPTVQALTRMSPFEVFHTSVEIKMEQGELCAAAVVAKLQGQATPVPSFVNTCYSLTIATSFKSINFYTFYNLNTI